MKSTAWKIAPFLVVLSGVAAAFACDTTGTDDPTCDPVCDGVLDCDGTSCLAYCIGLRDACSAKSQDSAFSDWATCQPKLECQSGSFVASPTSCQLPAIEVIACGTPLVSETLNGTGTGTGSSIIFATSSGQTSSFSTGTATVTFNPSSSSSELFDAGDDTSFDGGEDAGDDASTESEGGVDSGLVCDAGVCCGNFGLACTSNEQCCSQLCTTLSGYTGTVCAD